MDERQVVSNDSLPVITGIKTFKQKFNSVNTINAECVRWASIHHRN